MDTTRSKNFRRRRLLIGGIGFVGGFVIYFAIGFFIGDKVPSWILGGKYPTIAALVVGLVGSTIALAYAEKRKRIPTTRGLRNRTTPSGSDG